MAIAWDDHPQWSRGHLVIFRPELLKTMTVDEAGGITYPVEDIDFDGEAGATTWDKKNTFCTATFNDASTLWFNTNAMRLYFTKGIAPVFEIDETSNILTLPHIPNGINTGEINILDNYQIFIWDDFRPWALPVTFTTVSGNPRYARKKGNIAAGNSMREWAWNIGSAGVFTQAGASGYADVDFSLDAVSPRNDTPLGNSEVFGVSATLTASTENGANVIANAYDGNSATYWESTGAANEWVKADLGAANADGLTAFGIWIYDAGSFPQQITVEGSDDDATYVPVAYKIPTTSPISNSTDAYYMVDLDRNVTVYRYYRFTFSAPQSTSTFTIRRFRAYTFDPDDLSNDPDWDVGNATIVTGSTSTTDVTVRYPVGCYWIKAGDWSTTGYWQLARRPVCVLDSEKKYATNYGATASASNYTGSNTPAKAFDKDLTEYLGWGYTSTSEWLNIEYPSERCFSGFRIMAGWDDEFRPKSIQIQFKNEMSGAYSAIYTNTDLGIADDATWYEFAFDAPVWAKTFRLQVNSVNSGSNIFVRELEYIHALPYGFAQQRAEVLSHTMTRDGQEMTFRCYDDLSDYPPGTLIMYREDEYYQGIEGSLSAADPTGQDREGLMFVGWIDEQRTRVTRDKNGKRAYTDLVCYDIGGWARRMLYVPPVMKNFADPVSTTPIDGYRELGLLSGLNIDYAIFMILTEFSSLLELADFYHSETWFQYRIPILQFANGNFYDIAAGLAQKMGRVLTVNKMGQFKVWDNAQLLASGDRISTNQGSIGSADILSWDYAKRYLPQVGQLRAGAITPSAKGYDNVSGGMATVFATAPDNNALGIGPAQVEFGEQIVVDQAELNTRTGQMYSAVYNPSTPPIVLELAHGNDSGIDPARFEPILLTIDDDSKGPTGETFTNKRAYPISLTIRRDHENRTKRATLTVELEVDGVDAETTTLPA